MSCFRLMCTKNETAFSEQNYYDSAAYIVHQISHLNDLVMNTLVYIRAL